MFESEYDKAAKEVFVSNIDITITRFTCTYQFTDVTYIQWHVHLNGQNFLDYIQNCLTRKMPKWA